MKILLINDNPVVNKLVTLSAQKTSDELEVVVSVDSIASTHYNLVVIDDTLYNDDMFVALKGKISFDKSLYICSRDAEEVDGFNEVLKKPFLPTDLVEIFIKIGNSASDLDIQDDFTLLDEKREPKVEDTLSEEDLGLDDLDEDEISLDAELGDLELDDLDELDDDEIDDTLGESVLDDDEAQKVKDLLDDTEDINDEDLKLEDSNMEDYLDLESNFSAEKLETKTVDEENLDDSDLDLSEDNNEILEENLDIDDGESETQTVEDELEDLNLDSQIKSAVDELSDEDLESEVNEETLIDIVSGDLDTLTSDELKLAVGENIESKDELETNVEEITGTDVVTSLDENSENVEGVEALKTLLTALTDKKVAASMKGMKISINITLGDK